MSSRFIDRRPNGRHKSAVNRQRFLRRFKSQIQKAVRNAIAGRSIKNIDEAGEKITIPAKDISEPQYQFDVGGTRSIVLPGNQQFISGDKIKRPPQGGDGSGAGQASNAPEEDEDNFAFEISRQEFLDIFFEELALPNLIKAHIHQVPAFKMVRAGFSSNGVPTNLNIVRSLRGALGRKIALTSPYRIKVKELEAELEKLILEKGENAPEIEALKKQIESLRIRMLAIPFLDPIDLRYNNRVRIPKPSTQAVMFCLMDVSGSMDEAKKDIAKRFFILLYLFLSRNYENVQVVFIRHHTAAKEVNEEDFFYSRETGGTVVSSALELMRDIITKRYPSSDWNIYGAQASDGDNWNNDSPLCRNILIKDIMPLVQYFAYVEITPRQHQSLWEAYLSVQEKYTNFAMQNIDDVKDIYPVFRELFKKQAAG